MLPCTPLVTRRAERMELRSEFRQGLAEVCSELIKWMFVFWAGTMLTVVGLLKF